MPLFGRSKLSATISHDQALQAIEKQLIEKKERTERNKCVLIIELPVDHSAYNPLGPI